MLESIDLDLVGTTTLLAGAIAADAIAFTLCDFEANSRGSRALRWIVWVTGAHWALAAVGLLGTWTLRADLPDAAPFVQLATTLLLCGLILQIVLNATHGAGAARTEKSAGFAAKVWIVSADALFVGAGESAATAAWTHEEIVGSLLLLGPMVLACVASAVLGARWIAQRVRDRRIRSESVDRAGLVGVPTVVVPIFSYFVICAVRDFPVG